MRKLAFIVIGILLACGAASAEERKAHVGLHAGVLLPQLGASLDTTLGGRLEGGVQVWRRLLLFAGVGYAQPQVDGAAGDPRLTADAYTTSTTQREMTLTAGLAWRFLPRSARANVLAGAGFRAYLLETITNGEAGGESFLENRETSTRYGAVVTLGGELCAGPGAVAFTLEAGGSDLPHLITGDVATTALALEVGYRVFLW